MSVKLEDTIYLHFGTASATTGAATDADSTPTCTVEEDGVALGYAPTVTNVATGLYRITIACTTGNGFEAGKRYSVYVVAAVGGITGRDSVAEFPVEANELDDVPAAVWAVVGALGKTYGIMFAEIDASTIVRLAAFQAGSTTLALVLDASASALDDFYNRTTITVVTGASAGQNRLINDYVGSTRTAYLDRPLLVGAPAGGDYFAIDTRGNTRSASDVKVGVAAGGGVSTITLQADASAQNDYYINMMILIESGTGAEQTRRINGYDGATKVATVDRPWVTQPDTTSRYVMLPFARVKVAEIEAGAITATEAPALANIDVAVSTLATAVDLATVDGKVDAIKLKTDNLPEGIKKNAALAAFEFLMVDSTDGVTPKTGLTITAQRSIDGGAFGACTNSATEVSLGIYKIDLAAADTNGDVITYCFTGTAALARYITVKTNP